MNEAFLFGFLCVVDNGEAVVEISFAEKVASSESLSPLAKTVKTQLADYFAGKRTAFDVPFKLSGTEFQRAVWEQLLTIPYGETRTYKQVAEAIGRPRACRAVGLACNQNKIAIVVPCHRVVGQNGKMIGYAGGLELKMRLLQLEIKKY